MKKGYEKIKSTLYEAAYSNSPALVCTKVNDSEFVIHGMNFTDDLLIAAIDAIFEHKPQIAERFNGNFESNVYIH